MTDPNNPIIQKVRKLLNLADPARGGTEHERDTAMKMAQKLMFEHDLEMFQITEDSEQASGVTHHRITVEGKTKQWRGMLLHYIGSGCNVMVLYTKLGIKLSVWTMIGTPDNIELVTMLHTTLVPWLMSQCAMDRRIAQPSNPNAFNRAFYDTAGKVISYRLQQQQDILAHGYAKGTDLVLARDAQNQDYANNLFKTIKTSRSRGYSNVSGMQAGHVRGNQADINPNTKLRP